MMEQHNSHDLTLDTLAAKARAAATVLARTPAETKAKALRSAAAAIKACQHDILSANEQDVAKAHTNGLTAAMIDRLVLDADKINAIADSLDAIAELQDPVGAVMDSWTRPNGLKIERVRTPIGVIGVIYESRPNVTVDAAALCIKSGNAALLRGGSDAFGSSKALFDAMVQGLTAAGLVDHAAQLIETPDRAMVGAMLAAQGKLDIIVPRGGKSLVARVQAEAKVPVFAHLDGNNHVYVDQGAKAQIARDVVLNSKMRRTGICGALETLLVHSSETELLQHILQDLVDAGCSLYGDEQTCALFDQAAPAVAADWSTEYLEAKLAVKMVDSMEDAIRHIETYGSGHTDCIITENTDNAAAFMQQVDSAIVMHNASTQFADGGEFGMGAEIGIATGRIHARGPVGCEQLTTFSYNVHGSGQVRPK